MYLTFAANKISFTKYSYEYFLFVERALFAKGRAPQATSTFPPLHTSTKLSPSTPHGLEPPSSTCTNS
jgi:hypothetical protein